MLQKIIKIIDGFGNLIDNSMQQTENLIDTFASKLDNIIQNQKSFPDANKINQTMKSEQESLANSQSQKIQNNLQQVNFQKQITETDFNNLEKEEDQEVEETLQDFIPISFTSFHEK